MRKILLIFTVFFYFVLGDISVANSSSITKITPAMQLDNLLLSTHSLQADFTQTVNDINGQAISTASGKFYLIRPGKFRWQIEQPDQELLIGTKNKIYIYNKELKQVTIKKLNKNLGEVPALLLTQQDIVSANHFSVRLDGNKIGDQQWFILRPKEKNSFFAEIHLGFSHQLLIAMQMRDNLDQVTTIEFKQTKRNINLANQLFIFKIPTDTDVIDETIQ